MSYVKQTKIRNNRIKPGLLISMISSFISLNESQRLNEYSNAVAKFYNSVDIDYLLKMDTKYKIYFKAIDILLHLYRENSLQKMDKTKVCELLFVHLHRNFNLEDETKYLRDILEPTILEKSKYPSKFETDDYILRTISIILTHNEIISKADKLQDGLSEITSNGNTYDYDANYNNVKTLINDLGKSIADCDYNASDKKYYTLSDFTSTIMDTYDTATNPQNKIVTGLSALNESFGIAGGLINSWLYLFFARSGTFKSWILEHLAVWTVKYNSRNYVEEFKRTGIKPTVMFFSLENDIQNDNERLFKLFSGIDIRDVYRRTDVQPMLNGILERLASCIDIQIFSSDANDTIVDGVYKGGFSIDDIRSRIIAAENDNRKVVLAIVDYLELIRVDKHELPVSANQDTAKFRYITEGLLNIAKTFKIPVVSAQQLNREGTRLLLDEIDNGNYDGIRKLNPGHISGSHEIIKVTNWGCYMDVITNNTTGDRFIGFKPAKNRGATSDNYMDVFYYKLHNKVLFEEDLYKSIADRNCFGSLNELFVIKPKDKEKLDISNINEQSNKIVELDDPYMHDNYVTYKQIGDEDFYYD